MLGLLLLMGLFAGVCSGLLGVGGGFILIPLLLLLRIPMEVAVSASLVFVLFTSASGILRHGFQGTVDGRLAAIVTASSVLTAVAGSLLTARLPPSALQALLGGCILAGLVLMNRRPKPKVWPRNLAPASRWVYARTAHYGSRVVSYQVDFLKGGLVGGAAGFMAGLLGVGGGVLMIPLFVGLMAIPFPVAIGTSLVTILVSAFAGALTHWGQGSMEAVVAWSTALMGVIGAQVGATLVLKLKERALKGLLNGLLVSSAAYLFLRAGMGL